MGTAIWTATSVAACNDYDKCVSLDIVQTNSLMIKPRRSRMKVNKYNEDTSARIRTTAYSTVVSRVLCSVHVVNKMVLCAYEWYFGVNDITIIV